MRSDPPQKNQIPVAVDYPPNPLGNPEMESISIFERNSIFSPPPKDTKKPFPHQAMALKTYETLCCSLERISDKVDSILYIDILLQVLTLLASSLENIPHALMYALKDLGLTSVERLLDILYERNLTSDNKLYTSPQQLKKEKEVLVKIIQTILMEKEQELAHMMELTSNFLNLYANGRF